MGKSKKRQVLTPQDELTDLIKKLLALRLFELGVPQGGIGRRLRMSINSVNGFLKGIKKKDAKKETR